MTTPNITGYAVFYHDEQGNAHTATFTEEMEANQFTDNFAVGSTLTVPVVATVTITMTEPPEPKDTRALTERRYEATINLIKTQGINYDKDLVIHRLWEIATNTAHDSHGDWAILHMLKTILNLTQTPYKKAD